MRQRLRRQYYDAHCHLFNGHYLVQELLEIARQMRRGEYEHDGLKPERANAPVLTASAAPWQAVVRTIATLHNRWKGSSADNYQYAVSEWRESRHQAADLLVIPLMMDIFFLLAAPQGFDVTEHPHVIPTEEEIIPLEEEAGTLQRDMLAELKRVISEKTEFLDEMREHIGRSIKEYFARLRNRFRPPEPDVFDFDFREMFLTPGYVAQLEELIQLQQAQRGRVFPFLAVDPRREGIADFLRDGTVVLNGHAVPVVSHQGPFYGVKIYPPLGYLPDHPVLQQVYDFCIERDLPITTHCQPASFYAFLFESQQASDGVFYAHPKNWEPILTQPRFRNLRLNMAHFGGSAAVNAYAADPDSPDAEWARWIARWMRDCPHIYTDTAALVDPEAAVAIREILARDPLVRERLLFGSDYLINLLQPALGGDLAAFYNRFATLPEECYTRNTQAFLHAKVE